tara:strand:+ start:111 stop:722 length:612 start_codon:yes stop_codon:yes gene_type:complete
MTNSLHNLFPVPVMVNESWREPTIAEREYFTRIRSEERVENIGNSYTKENHILDAPEMISLKEDLTYAINSYFQEIWKPIYDVEVYITISWINFTEMGQFHHNHVHTNSAISGVYYIDTDDSDKIHFTNPQPTWLTMRVESREWNDWNCGERWISTPKNSLVLFPSKLRHNVSATTNPNTRISLSFNTFFKGKLSDDLDEIVL